MQQTENHAIDRGGVCAELLTMAQRELSALYKAVTELFGAEQAELLAEAWLHEVESSRSLPASVREYRLITMKVMAHLADRCGHVLAIPARFPVSAFSLVRTTEPQPVRYFSGTTANIRLSRV